MEQQEERTVSFFRFEDLRVYTKATDYATWVTTNVAGDEKHKSLVGAFCHSAYDIALNIAEGSSRSKSQFDHYLKIAKTAIRECVVYTEVAANLGLFTPEQKEQSREFLMELTRMLGALIISLQRSAERRQARGEGDADTDDYSSNDEMSY